MATRRTARDSHALALGLLALAAAVSLAGEPRTGRADDASAAARLGSGDEASEYWDVTATFESGHRVFARFSISNEGPGDRTGYALGQIVFPDGRVVPFQNGRTEGSWHLSDDRLRLQIGSSVLDLHGPNAHFEVDKNKTGIKFYLDFPFDPKVVHGWASAPPRYRHDLLALGEVIGGTIWVRDVVTEPATVRGRVTVTHVSMDESEPGLALRRIEALLPAAQDGSSVYALDLTPVKGARRSWIVVRRPDGAWLASDRSHTEIAGRGAGSSDAYPIAAALELAGDDARGRIEAGALILSHDPLEIAPRPFRWLLSFRTEPRQVWVGSRWTVEWVGPGGPFALAGEGVSSFYFLNEIPRGSKAGGS